MEVIVVQRAELATARAQNGFSASDFTQDVFCMSNFFSSLPPPLLLSVTNTDTTYYWHVFCTYIACGIKRNFVLKNYATAWFFSSFFFFSLTIFNALVIGFRSYFDSSVPCTGFGFHAVKTFQTMHTLVIS